MDEREVERRIAGYREYEKNSIEIMESISNAMARLGQMEKERDDMMELLVQLLEEQKAEKSIKRQLDQLGEKTGENLEIVREVKKHLEISEGNVSKLLKRLQNEIISEKNSLEKRLNEEIEKNEQLKKQWEEALKRSEKLKSELDKLRKVISESKGLEEEIKKETDLYLKYKQMNGNIKKALNSISDNSFVEFIVSCSKPENLLDIYEKIGRPLRDGIKNCDRKLEEELQILNGVIEYCIDRINSSEYGLKLERQQVKVGEEHESSIHSKNEDGKFVGNVTKVILQGVLNYGDLYGNCKAIVEVER